MLECVECGSEFEGHHASKYCSNECKQVIKKCECCGKEFTVKQSKSDQKYCSRSCTSKSIEKREIESTCENCGSVYTGEKHSKYCSATCRNDSLKEERNCKECGEVFRCRKAHNNSYCSSKCASLARRSRVKCICENCGEEYLKIKSRRDSKYCSRECMYSARSITKSCAQCGSEFTCTKSDSSQKYCCRECYLGSHRVTQCCDECGDIFKVPKSRAPCRYCSHECRSKRPTIQCEYCGEKFSVPPSRKSAKFCSKECMNKCYSGKGSPSWRGGGDSYYGKNWQRVRRIVRNRDCFRCRKCGKHEDEYDNELDVHHIVPFREFDEPEEANTPNNLVTVCRSCHGKIEGDVEAGRALL